MARTKIRKGYFYEREENAVVDYIKTDSIEEKNKIFNEILFPAFTKMVESIIRRYKLYVPDEEFNQTFDDTISYLLTKISNFKPVIVTYEEINTYPSGNPSEVRVINESDLHVYLKKADDTFPKYIEVDSDNGDISFYKRIEKHYKAYSYCGTVCKHYLMSRNIKYTKDLQTIEPYDIKQETLENSMRYSTNLDDDAEMATELMGTMRTEIQKMIDDPVKNNLNSNQLAVGVALSELFNNWQQVLDVDGSNKLQKSSVLYYLREETKMTTSEVRKNMRPYKNIYRLIKETYLQNN